MRCYSKNDVQKIENELMSQSESLSSEIEVLREKRKDLKFFQVDQKKDIDRKIQELSDQRYFVNVASMMFMLF